MARRQLPGWNSSPQHKKQSSWLKRKALNALQVPIAHLKLSQEWPKHLISIEWVKYRR